MIVDCGGPAVKRGWCTKHYKRWLRHGDPLAGGPFRVPGRTCNAKDCGKPVEGHGWCVKHLWRWKKGKDPEAPTWHDMTLEERFWTKVNKDGPVSDWHPELGPCWIWDKGKTGSGYGAFCPGNGDTVLAHRWSYEHSVRAIPEGLELDHLCRQPACVRPSHLDPVTGGVNQHRSPLTFASINSGKAYCDNGHEFTPENTRTKSDGARECKECRRAITRRHHARQRAGDAARAVATGVRLTIDQQGELRDWVESGRALALREAAGLSRPAAAQDLGVAASALWRWEHGQKFPRPEHAASYYRFLAALNDRRAAA